MSITVPEKRPRFRFGIAHGRFQPLHREHEDYLLTVAALGEHLVVAVTNPFLSDTSFNPESPHRHRMDANPFTYFERFQMARDVLLAAGKAATDFSIVPLNLLRPETWAEALPHPSESGFYIRLFSDWERKKARLFEASGYRACPIDEGKGKTITATEVRRRMKLGGDWKSLTPAACHSIIERRMDRDVI